jgi:hypothetical protein
MFNASLWRIIMTKIRTTAFCLSSAVIPLLASCDPSTDQELNVVAPHVLPLFGSTNPQVLAWFRGDVEVGASGWQCRHGGARDHLRSVAHRVPTRIGMKLA